MKVTGNPVLPGFVIVFLLFAGGCARVGVREPTPVSPAAVTAAAVRTGAREIVAGDGSEMVLVEAGEFRMGSPDGVGLARERPRRLVYLDAYYIDKYPVTVAQYRAFCATTGREMPPEPSWGWQDDQPMVNVTWHEAAAYAEYHGKRLPTEAEWEKAARAGTETLYSFGDSASDLGEYAWYWVNSGDRELSGAWDSGKIIANNNRTHPVGRKRPNGWGIHDMLGNAWEWCADWYDSNYYANAPARNPAGPSAGTLRVLRGGGWLNIPVLCRPAYRNYGFVPDYRNGNLGFRCAAPAAR